MDYRKERLELYECQVSVAVNRYLLTEIAPRCIDSCNISCSQDEASCLSVIAMYPVRKAFLKVIGDIKRRESLKRIITDKILKTF